MERWSALDKQQLEIEKIVVEEMWLHYYNKTLYKLGFITQQRYIKMLLAIFSRTDKKRKSLEKELAEQAASQSEGTN